MRRVYWSGKSSDRRTKAAERGSSAAYWSSSRKGTACEAENNSTFQDRRSRVGFVDAGAAWKWRTGSTMLATEVHGQVVSGSPVWASRFVVVDQLGQQLVAVLPPEQRWPWSRGSGILSQRLCLHCRPESDRRCNSAYSGLDLSSGQGSWSRIPYPAVPSLHHS